MFCAANRRHKGKKMLIKVCGLLILYLLILFVGHIAAKRALSGNLTDHILGGRNLSLPLGFFTLTAAWVGGGFTLGTAESIYSQGLWWTLAPLGYTLSLIIAATFYAPKIYRPENRTFLDPFQRQFGLRTTGLFLVPALIGELMWSAAVLAALGYALKTLLGIPFEVSVVLSGTVALFNTFHGGFWTVTYTDVLQLLLMFFGLLISIPFIAEHVPNVLDTWSFYLQNQKLEAPFIKNHGWSLVSGLTWLDQLLLLTLGGIPWGCYFQKVLACKTKKIATQMSYLAAFGSAFAAIPAAIIGILAFSLFHNTDQLTEAANVLPQTISQFTPHWVTTLGLAAIASAILSSVDSSILSSATLFTINIVAPSFPNLSEKKLTKVSRISTLAVGVLTILVAIQVKSVYNLWALSADLVYTLLFPQLTCVLFFKQLTRIGALSGFWVGAFTRLYFVCVPSPHLPFYFISMILSLLTIIFVSLLTEKSPVIIESDLLQ